MKANLATFALYSGLNFVYGHFFCGSLASATAFKTSLFASAISAVGIYSYSYWLSGLTKADRLSDQVPTGSEAEMSSSYL